MPASGWGGSVARLSERVGRSTGRGLEEFGFGASLLGESVYWLLLGRRNNQPVRVPAVFARAMEIGVAAIPIVTLLTFTIGVMIAIQGIHSLKPFGAESQVVIGIAFSVTREFAPLITGILVAGRSGSALAARLGTMTISQEVDALRVIGINPIRFLVVPELLAMLVMLPALSIWADGVALTAGGLYVSSALGMSLSAYFDRTFEVLEAGDILHGVYKSLIFATLITLVGVVNGASVKGGAEGVGRVTTRSVVHAISAIVIADMLFVFLSTRT